MLITGECKLERGGEGRGGSVYKFSSFTSSVHVCTCVQFIISFFSEYVDGGTLRKTIKNLVRLHYQTKKNSVVI